MLPLLPPKVYVQPATFTQAVPPRPKVVGELLRPEIFAPTLVPFPGVTLIGAMLTVAAVFTVKLCVTTAAAE